MSIGAIRRLDTYGPSSTTAACKVDSLATASSRFFASVDAGSRGRGLNGGGERVEAGGNFVSASAEEVVGRDDACELAVEEGVSQGSCKVAEVGA